ncbi:MAG: gfo/Idh/MocA family oxidoreductase [Calditrichaeota bacterium]|nr:MAG: gfo/Idh/MocA family oxidoreductase [Calditrichota bacterium]
MQTVTFGIVGCGRIAQRHAEHISNFGALHAVCDIKLERAEQLANKYGCRAYSNLKIMLQQEPECQVISVCTPNAFHAEHTILSLRAGKHVICEKPMALSTIDCKKMIEEAKKNKRKLFVVKQNRFNPPVVALKRAIEEGRLGNILNIQLNCFWNRNEQYYRDSEWKGRLALDGGTLFTQFSHFIDLIYWLNGDIKKVYPILKNMNHQKIIDFEDTGVIALEFENGALGTIHYTVNSYKKNMEGSITVFGTKGTVKVGGQYLNVLEYQSIADYEIPEIKEVRPANDYGFYQGSMSNHDKVYANVLDVLLNNGKIATNGEEAMKTVEIIEKIYRYRQVKACHEE